MLLASLVGEPRAVVPSKKVTVPVAETPPLSIAVNVSETPCGSPAAGIAGDAASVRVVGLRVDVELAMIREAGVVLAEANPLLLV